MSEGNTEQRETLVCCKKEEGFSKRSSVVLKTVSRMAGNPLQSMEKLVVKEH